MNGDAPSPALMSSPRRRRSSLLAGPLAATALIAFMLATNGGPGFAFLALAAAGLFMFAMPLLQLGLLALPVFKGRHGAAAVAAFGGLAAVLVALVVAGLFNIC